MSLIYDSDLVTEFSKHLPLWDINNDCVQLVLAGARKKYDQDVNKSVKILAHRVVKQDQPEFFLEAVEIVDAIFGVSKNKFYNVPISFSKKSGVIYSSVNPRSAIKALNATVRQMLEYEYKVIFQPMNDQIFEEIKDFNTHYLSNIQKNPSYKVYHIMDIDAREPMIPAELLVDENISQFIRFVTETKNGFHVIYNRQANEWIKHGNVVNQLAEKYGIEKYKIEYFKDRFTPVWGTLQGGFEVSPFTPSRWKLEDGTTVQDWMDDHKIIK